MATIFNPLSLKAERLRPYENTAEIPGKKIAGKPPRLTMSCNLCAIRVTSQHKTLLLGELYDGGGLIAGGDAVAGGLDRDEIAATHAGLRLNPVRAGHSPVQAAIIDGQTREH